MLHRAPEQGCPGAGKGRAAVSRTVGPGQDPAPQKGTGKRLLRCQQRPVFIRSDTQVTVLWCGPMCCAAGGHVNVPTWETGGRDLNTAVLAVLLGSEHSRQKLFSNLSNDTFRQMIFVGSQLFLLNWDRNLEGTPWHFWGLRPF